MINYLYIQDLKDRLTELEEYRDDYVDGAGFHSNEEDADRREAWDKWYETEDGNAAAEISELLATLDAERAEDGFIPENDFKEYAIEFAEDIGAIENCCHWPATCIDWEQAVDELKQDFSCFEYNGTTYYYR